MKHKNRKFQIETHFLIFTRKFFILGFGVDVIVWYNLKPFFNENNTLHNVLHRISTILEKHFGIDIEIEKLTQLRYFGFELRLMARISFSFCFKPDL